jgi:hypothetical protein
MPRADDDQPSLFFPPRVLSLLARTRTPDRGRGGEEDQEGGGGCSAVRAARIKEVLGAMGMAGDNAAAFALPFAAAAAAAVTTTGTATTTSPRFRNPISHRRWVTQDSHSH